MDEIDVPGQNRLDSQARPQGQVDGTKLIGLGSVLESPMREAGFVEVTVTGRSGDGGIDGTGIVRLQNVISLQVLFQCKRWQGSVPSREIRDFRGAMSGRTDKGLFITTGSFSREARKEATRDGAPPIDLIDGDGVLDLLQKLGLGLKQSIVVDEEWFEAFGRASS